MQQPYTTLVTGATGGLGIQLCKEFARHGFDLVITARSPEKLKKLAAWLRDTYGVVVKSIVADLNQEDGAKLLYNKTREMGIEVDVLVNNAGFGLGGHFVHNRPRLQEAMLRVNVQAPTQLCRLYLPGMLERGRGGILNVASTGSFVPGPNNAVYCAAKAYVLSLSEALAEELRGTPLHVTAVCPGAMDTGFADRAGMESTRLFNYGVMDPREAAHEAFRAFIQGRPVVVAGTMNKVLMAATRFVPRGVSTRLSGIAQRRR